MTKLIEGKLQIFNGSEWGSFCKEGFTNNDGQAICQHLRYGEVNSTWGVLRHGIISGPIHIDEMQCDSFETFLPQCEKFNSTFDGYSEQCAFGHDVHMQCEIPDVYWTKFSDWGTCFECRQNRTRTCRGNPYKCATQYSHLEVEYQHCCCKIEILIDVIYIFEIANKMGLGQ